jgi:hypothetical protein
MTQRLLKTLVLAVVGSLALGAPALAQRGSISSHSHGPARGGGGGSAAGWAGMGIGIAQGLRGASQNRNNNPGIFRGNNSNNYSNNHSNNHYQPNNNGYSQPGYGQQGSHYQPQATYATPQNRYVTPQSNHAAPQNTVAPATHTEVVKPPANLPPAVTVPHKNELKLAGRPLTADEIKRAREFFLRRMEELTSTALSRLPAIEFDQQKLTQVLIAQGVEAEIQIRLLDAVRGGDYSLAHELWLANCTSIEPPFRLSRLRRRLTEFCSRWSSGQALPADCELLETELVALGLETITCCGAPSLLEDIQQCLLVSQIVSHANPGQQNQMSAVPPGEVDIVFHPNLPEGESIVLSQQAVMLGTGGVGTFQVQHGNFAQAQGYPLLPGAGVPANDDRLILAGILIENPSDAPVQFTIDNQPFSLAPGSKQTFTGESRKIAFSTGERGQVTTYALPAGTFRFETPNRKWDLHRVKAFEATIDNTNNHAPFHYIVQGEHQEVAANSVATHSSSYPLIIRFDRGNGTDTKQIAGKEKQSKFTVGINPQDNLWDLWDVSDTYASPSAQPPGANPPPGGASRPAF